MNEFLFFRPFLNILNRVEIINHKRLTDQIHNRRAGVPLITVSNHCSSLDEPLLFSALIPWPIKQWQLRYSLWYFKITICTESLVLIFYELHIKIANSNDDMFFSLGEVFAQVSSYSSTTREAPSRVRVTVEACQA